MLKLARLNVRNVRLLGCVFGGVDDRLERRLVCATSVVKKRMREGMPGKFRRAGGQGGIWVGNGFRIMGETAACVFVGGVA